MTSVSDKVNHATFKTGTLVADLAVTTSLEVMIDQMLAWAGGMRNVPEAKGSLAVD
jgi:hypothetical protein